MTAQGFTVRAARPADADAVTAVLASAYPTLMAPHYDADVLALVLPAMARANPALLASGTYYVQEAPDGRIAACGGWTHAAPGTGAVEPGIAHIRHFGTHADWTRRGLGAGIFDRCRRDAQAASLQAFRCVSSLGAESFYAALGFRTLARTDTRIGGRPFPTVTMAWPHPQAPPSK